MCRRRRPTSTLSTHGRTPADRLHGGRVDASLPPRTQAAAGCAQRHRHRARRHRLRPPGRLRLGHRNTPPRRTRRGRRAVQPLPRDLALLADESVLLHRPQSPCGRDGLPGRHPARLSRLPRPAAQDGRHAPPPPARRRLFDDGRRQVAPHATLAALGSGALRHLAPRTRVRALLRLPAGGHQPLDPEPRLRQPLRRAATPARGRATT